ncbi:hypothetical protein P0F40_003283 [Vibrio metschnikovii]|uniref:hypothetical protein n=1 Tax=Vibrio metschnikovii TaxID=28172 RepID=UPI002A5149D9|nr:hypothetical protein [Vibrio metschnikovii]EKO3722708.1 hypothetical protein [Vibrio metschnikovii]EKO3726206.1 hypothetical protein [Vibrio metschnikovii]EKO3881497.1 hypothetical protein [Vibrio metschnikovii]EKO3940795.1 hypothetical protein [Vibrio metschnikovii]
MSKRNPEKELIESFKKIITSDSAFGIKVAVNFGADSDTVADVEYLANNDKYLILEAKSHKSSNAQNTRHQIFGQLLKEQGKENDKRRQYDNKAVFGLLIPGDKAIDVKGAPKSDGVTYYRDGFTAIPESKFSAFGDLVNAEYVFVCFGMDRIEVFSWLGFYSNDKPIHTIPSPNITNN